MRYGWIAGAAAVAAMVLPSTVWAASDVDILLEKLVEKGILTQADAGQIRTEISETKATPNTPLAKETAPEAARNWQWSGDVRLREEYRNRTGGGQDVNRQRLRLRYGFDTKITDHLKAGTRLTTGSTTNPLSPNQSFNTAFNHVNVVLDRAYLTYATELPGISDVSLMGGFIGNPFWTVGQLVWDDDLNFTGAAAHLANHFGPVTVFSNGGVFPLITDITEAATLWSIQGGASVTPFLHDGREWLRNAKLTGALAYHDYVNVTNPLSESSAITTATGSNPNGNTTGIQDLNLLNATVELASQADGVPFSLFGDWVRNTAVAADNNGFQLGLKIGKAKKPWDLKSGWEGGYYFERLEPDATFGAFTDSDFGNGGTNHRGHVYWLKLAVLNNSYVAFKYFNTQELTGSKNHADTVQMDLGASF